MTRMRRLRLSIILFSLLLAAAMPLLANGTARAGAAAAAPGAERGEGGRGARQLAGTALGPPVSTARFSLEFVDAELVDVFQALATQSGVNIALSGSVKGKTTLRLRNVTLPQAMNIITRLNGLDYAWVEAAYVVGTPEEVRAMKVSELRSSVVVLQHIPPEYAQEVLAKLTPDVTVSTQKGVRSILLLAPEESLAKAERALAEIDVAPLPTPPSTEVVPIRYLKAEQMAEMIAGAVPEAKVQPGPQENSLLITADSRQWEAVRSLIAATDAAPAPAQATQALYYAKYVSASELKDTLASLLPDLSVTLAPRSFTPQVQRATGGAGATAQLLAAPQLAAGGATGGGGGAAAQQEVAPVTALVLSGAPWTVEHGLQLLEKLDVAPRQVHISALVTEVNRDDVSRLGIEWLGLGATGAAVTVGEATRDEDGNLVLPDIAETPMQAHGLQIGKIVRSPLQWRGAIHALEELQRARILSNPSVITLDGRQTTLHTGDTIYYPVVVGQGATVGYVTDTRTVETGVNLLVNPRVNNDGEVTLTISPSVSSAVFGALGLPIVTEQALVTTVRVKNGETAVLAGMVTDKDRVLITKVPLLGDLPIVGELFKFRRRSPAHQEILIFVTPTIVQP